MPVVYVNRGDGEGALAPLAKLLLRRHEQVVGPGENVSFLRWPQPW